jgi:transposase
VLVGLEGFEVLDAVEEGGRLVVTVRVARGEAPCPRCGVFSGRVKQYRRQRVRDGLSFDRPTVLEWIKRRLRCDTPGCRESFTESTPQVPPRARLTERLRASIATAGKDRSTAAVAKTYLVSWWTAWRAVAAAAARRLAARPATPPKRLGVDETAFRRPRRFMTGLVDLDTGRLWDVVEGRSKAVLVHRLRLLGDDVMAIESVVIDPYAGYKAAVRDLAPHAVRVADRFHIERLAAQAVTDVRCRRQQELTGHRGRKGDPLYAVRRDLIRGRERLTERGRARLAAAFRADHSDELECAWTLKEALRDLYAHSTDRPDATRELAAWHRWAKVYDVPECHRLARTLRAWEPELLAYFDTRLTNGPTEGRNLIIKTVKRQGFGYRNPQHYRLRLLYRCA